MPTWLITLIPTICMLVPCAGLFIYLKRQEREDRKSPLVDDLLRLPGETLNERFREGIFDLCGVFAASVLLPAIGLLMLLNSWVDPTRIKFGATAVIAAVMIFGGVAWSLWKAVKVLRTITTTKRGLEGELATAQLLTPLLAEGWQLFHDLPMKRSNIDHVLVGPTGVYAIETKYRSKRLSLKGKESAQAEYDGSSIRFAGGANEHLPVQQAQAVAGELSKWLHGKLGEPVSVAPVVALPGWFVKTTHKPGNGQAYVINPKVHYLFQKRPAQIEQSIQIRVAAALRELAVRPAPGANQ
ncbi:nuclease-related domain-containing protein [Pseudomonas sp. BMS12]|uniref:nuclease-related domain-containing protein n=1 Tax=Pseudomonas sp. BMS12 TaxID=1796033 RepID=UPI00083A13EF|nr:nuclease-related domain-containing protein [Pseudomonas sp. BMS12]